LAEKMLTTPPEQCAADILAGIESGKRRILTGNMSSTLFALSRFMPDTYPALIRALVK